MISHFVVVPICWRVRCSSVTKYLTERIYATDFTPGTVISHHRHDVSNGDITVWPTTYSGSQERKIQAQQYWPFVVGIHLSLVDFLTKERKAETVFMAWRCLENDKMKVKRGSHLDHIKWYFHGIWIKSEKYHRAIRSIFRYFTNF